MEFEDLDIINRELRQGETLVWAGHPRRGFYLKDSDPGMILFSLFWGGFAIFWEYGVVTSHAGLFFILWGIPFVTIGIYMMIGRFFHDAWVRGRISYGLTNKRVLIVIRGRTLKVHSHRLATLPGIQMVELADGTGSIDLTPDVERPRRRGDWGRKYDDAYDSRLERIKDVRAVFDQITRLQQQSSTETRN